MKIDLLDRVRDYLVAGGFNEVVVKRLDAFTGDNGTIITMMNYSRTGSYYNGLEEGDYSFAITTRRLVPSDLNSSAEAEARELISDIIERLDGANIASGNGSYRMSGGLELTGVPLSIASPDKDKAYMWQCALTAHIEF